ncbi:hypothetical protein TELCIR_19147 [Teladorsagia circumcincta]|uniref:Uncharacterized protein n=1 Tax=Teladorsagia circumcincta TaxID=45464 RepID=A0A2G9TPL0_TELCI|nr:hypothetical protein TELCIR_19147 [Teladorsagia circumcincta]
MDQFQDYYIRFFSSIFFSTETKAVALILMALKLCFGLDDKREFYSPALAVVCNNEVSSDEGASFYRIVLPTRESGFDHCVPASMKIDNSTSIPNPFPEDTCDIKPNLMDDESLYGSNLEFSVPLRRQTTALREYLLRPRTTAEKQEVRNIVDETAVKIFKTEFTKCALAQSLPVKDDSISTTHYAKTSADAQRTRWYSYFPCAKGYVVLFNFEDG